MVSDIDLAVAVDVNTGCQVFAAELHELTVVRVVHVVTVVQSWYVVIESNVVVVSIACNRVDDSSLVVTFRCTFRPSDLYFYTGTHVIRIVVNVVGEQFGIAILSGTARY